MLPTQQPCEGYGTGTVTLFSKKEKWKPHPKLVTVWPRQPKHVSQTPSLVIFTMLGLIPADMWHKLPSYQVVLFQEHQGTEGNRRPAGGSWEVALLTLVLGPYRLGWKRRTVWHEGLLWGAQHYTSCPTVKTFLHWKYSCCLWHRWWENSIFTVLGPHLIRVNYGIRRAQQKTQYLLIVGSPWDRAGRQNGFLLYPSLKNINSLTRKGS